MIAEALGRRYERLLLFSAPLSIFCLLLLFFAMGSSGGEDRVEANCLMVGAKDLQKHINEFNEKWIGRLQLPYLGNSGLEYKLLVDIAWINEGLQTDCYKFIRDEINKRYARPPRDMIEGMQRDASMIFEKPIRYSGVEIPQTTKISLFGNDIKIGINSLARALQFGIAPLLLLWLASLYNTRIRETIAIKDSELISEVFPHVINLYPSGRVLPPRKKSLIKSTAPKIISTLYFISRSILLLAFILPPTASYIYGLYLLSTDDYGAVFILLGALVLMFAFFNILVELLPWHFSKFFPSPIDN